MSWLKHVVVDLVITVIIVLATVLEQTWAQWIVWIYTPLMLALKALAVVSGGVARAGRQQGAVVPMWFWHLLYAVNVALLAWAAWWVWAAQWALIWVLSVVADARAKD